MVGSYDTATRFEKERNCGTPDNTCHSLACPGKHGGSAGFVDPPRLHRVDHGVLVLPSDLKNMERSCCGI